MIELFLGISPHEPLLTKLQKDMVKYCSAFDSVKPLNFPPHITLVSRFLASSILELADRLMIQLEKAEPFKARLDGIGHFKEPPILFYHPSDSVKIKSLHNLLMDLCEQNSYVFAHKNKQSVGLSDMQESYADNYGNRYVREFYQPHMTLAGPDVNILKFGNFLQDTLPEVNISCDVSDVCIYMEHGKRWIIEKRIPLGS